MSTQPIPSRDPIADEARAILDQDPALKADLDDFERRLAAGELSADELISHNEVRRTLQERGLLEAESAHP